VKERIEADGLSIEEFKALDANQRRFQVGRLEAAFVEDFFSFTRDNGTK